MPVIDAVNAVGPDNVPRWFDFSPLNGVDIGDGMNGDVGALFSALPERAGLKLEPRKIPVQIFVIDHVEKPSAN